MANDIKKVVYSPNPNSREYQIFPEEYFSGCDVAVFIDGKEVTDITGFQYTVQEQLKPIYGYASRTFDDVAIGNRIVVGMFKVAVKDIHNLEKMLGTYNDGTQPAPPKTTPAPSWTGQPGQSVESAVGKAVASTTKPTPPKTTTPPTGGNTPPATNTRRALRYVAGNIMKGDDVKELQQILKTLGYYTGLGDGSFGPLTRSAVIKFQTTRGLTANGIAGPKTWAELDKAMKTPAPAHPTIPGLPKLPLPPGSLPNYDFIWIGARPTLTMGSKGDAVKYVQFHVAATADGTFGTGTRTKVIAFQQLHKLSADGVVGPKTWERLIEVVRIKLASKPKVTFPPVNSSPTPGTGGGGGTTVEIQ